MDACYRSAKSGKWETVELPVWRGGDKTPEKIGPTEYDAKHWLIKEEMLPDGRKKAIIKDKSSGEISQKILNS
jgi:hypothetical protein